MFYKAIDGGRYSKQNPLKKVRFYRLNTRREVLSRFQIKKVIEVSREISQHPRSPLQKIFLNLVILALNTGMRKGEILNLEWQNIKTDELIIRGKGDRERSVPLNARAKEIIEKQPRRSDHVFDIPNRNQHDIFRRTVNRIRKKTGVNFNFHILRHCFTTALIEKGIDLITISEILGHSKLTTSLIYSHTDKGKKQKAVESLLE